MLPYVLLMFVPLVFSFLSFSSSFTEYNGKWSVSLGKNKEILEHSCLIPVFFMILIVLLALRDVSTGIDLENYRHYFYVHSAAELSYVIENSENDVLFWLLTWLIGQVTNSYQIYLTVIALLSVVPIAIVYSQDRRHGFLKVLLFMNMSTFVMLFSGLRQAVAIALGVVAFECAKKKQFFRFLLVALIALGMHHSAFVIFAFYPLYHITFKRKHLWFVIPSILLVFIFNKPIFTWATVFMSRFFGDKYMTVSEETGAYTMLILFILFAIFAYIIPDEKKMDKEMLGLRNMLLFAVLLQCFAPIHMLAMRLNYYFIIFIPILIPKLLTVVKPNIKDVAVVAKVVLVVFFTLYYLTTAYIACQTDGGSLNTYPYIPFWEN